MISSVDEDGVTSSVVDKDLDVLDAINDYQEEKEKSLIGRNTIEGALK